MYKFIDEGKQHLHTLNGKPLLGTSSVVGVINKPLAFWASGMACGVFGRLDPKKNTPEDCFNRAGEVLEQIKGLDTESYQSLLEKAYKAHNEKKEISAEEGTDMHAELEKYVKDCIQTNNGVPIVLNGEEPEKVSLFANWSIENVDEFIESEYHLYSETMWVGGISDCLAKMKDGNLAIIDFKSSKEAYESQFIQIGGYALQLEENGAYDKNGEKILDPIKATAYIIIPFGAEKFEPQYRYNTEQLKECFVCATKIYKLLNK